MAGDIWKTFLPGRFHITRGGRADYLALERFHYRRGRPATWAGVWVVRYAGEGCADRVVAVGVLSFACVNCDARDLALGIAGMPPGEKLRFVNEQVRVISRVVVHPQFRAMGLASRLVRVICEEGNVRWIEAMAAMGRVHPLFERGGMRCLGEGRKGVRYYLWERATMKHEDIKSSCGASVACAVGSPTVTTDEGKQGEQEDQEHVVDSEFRLIESLTLRAVDGRRWLAGGKARIAHWLGVEVEGRWRAATKFGDSFGGNLVAPEKRQSNYAGGRGEAIIVVDGGGVVKCSDGEAVGEGGAAVPKYGQGDAEDNADE